MQAIQEWKRFLNLDFVVSNQLNLKVLLSYHPISKLQRFGLEMEELEKLEWLEVWIVKYHQD